MLGHCRIDTSTATAEAARRYGANGADLARLATVAMEATSGGEHGGDGGGGDAGGSVGGERAGEGGEADVAEAEAARLDQVHDQERGAHERAHRRRGRAAPTSRREPT